MREEFEADKQDAVEKAVEKQEASVANTLDEQKRYYEAKIARLNENWLGKLNQSHQDLRRKLNNQFEKEMRLNAEQINRERDAEIEAIRVEMGKEVEAKEVKHKQELEEIACVEPKLKACLAENDELKRTIVEVTAEFQKCIQHFSHLKKEEAEFLFPLTRKVELTANVINK